jgi:hypothetical protein
MNTALIVIGGVIAMLAIVLVLLDRRGWFD